MDISLGFIIKLYTVKKSSNHKSDKKVPEVVIIIECNENQLEMVKDTLWDHHALGVRKLILGEGKQ